MAAGTLPAPGTEYGPCADTCEHSDCAQTREMAGTTCRLCPEAIGYETAFFREDEGLVHAVCRYNEIGRRARV